MNGSCLVLRALNIFVYGVNFIPLCSKRVFIIHILWSWFQEHSL